MLLVRRHRPVPDYPSACPLPDCLKTDLTPDQILIP